MRGSLRFLVLVAAALVGSGGVTHAQAVEQHGDTDLGAQLYQLVTAGDLAAVRTLVTDNPQSR